MPRGPILTRRRFVATTAAAGAWIAGQRRAQSQVVGKLTRMIVGFAPGGSSDVTARLLVDQMRGYASTIIIDNRPGAGGRIAVEAVKAGAPDGSVMLLSPASMIVLYPHLYKPLGYDPVQDFVAVTTVCAFPFVLSVGPLVPRDVRTLADFIQWCKANPKPIVALKTAWMVSNSRPLTTVSTNGKTIRPSGSMMLATKATHRTLVRTG